VNVLLVGGGGGGANGWAGGGGGGQVVLANTLSVTAGSTYSITVGGGGAGAITNGDGVDGSSSTFGALLSAAGGGGGGTGNSQGHIGGSSGGNGEDVSFTSPGPARGPSTYSGSGTAYGRIGGMGSVYFCKSGGGGGGAGSDGLDASGTRNPTDNSCPDGAGGAGGAGLGITIDLSGNFIPGSGTLYGAGGGGASSFLAGAGGAGGGGSGGPTGISSAGSNATGIGAGGGGGANARGGDGSAGVVVLVFPQMSAPTISFITPGQGPVSGGTTIHIFGANFLNSPVPTVTIDVNPCTSVQFISSSEITCVTPASTLPGNKSGAADVTVINNDSGTATATGTDSYVYGPITLTSDLTTLSKGDITTFHYNGDNPNIAVVFWVDGVLIGGGPIGAVVTGPVPWEAFYGGCTTHTAVLKVYNNDFRDTFTPVLTDASDVTLTITALGSPTSCNSISTSAIGSGTIDPTLPNITSGTSQVIHFAPTNGATISSIMIDGVPDATLAADIANGYYTFDTSGLAQHTIVVTFSGGNAPVNPTSAQPTLGNDSGLILGTLALAIGSIESGLSTLTLAATKNAHPKIKSSKVKAKKVKKIKRKS